MPHSTDSNPRKLSTAGETASAPSPSITVSDDVRKIEAFLLAEYNALRQEIIARSQAQQQIISLSLIVSGTLLTLGIKNGGGEIFFVIPILVFILALGWSRHDAAIKTIGGYIRYRIEPKVPWLSWETYMEGLRTGTTRSFWVQELGSIQIFGLFVLIQLLAAVLGIVRPATTSAYCVLRGSACLCIILTFFVARERHILNPDEEKKSIWSRFWGSYIWPGRSQARQGDHE